MSNEGRLHRELTERLYSLLELKKLNQGQEVNGLDQAIRWAMAPMSEEQIAWVEKLVNEA